MKVAVIGGGWAGIAAAVELTAAGADTTLYEAGRVLGGRARSINIAGRTLDNGQHILLGAYRETLALMRQVGANPETLFDRRPLQIIDNSGFRLALPILPAPLNVAWGLLTATGVGLGEKLRTAIWMDGIKRRTRAQMGRCQGGFCGPRVMEIICRETGKTMEEITKGGRGSWLVRKKEAGTC